MLKRNFNQSNKEYFAKYKFVLIGILAFLIIGLICGTVFGMKGNFEFTGYNEFSVTISSERSDKFSQYSTDIQGIVNSYGGNYDNVSVMDEGSDTKLVIRYLNDLTDENQDKINTAIITKVTDCVVSDHIEVAPTVRAVDYVYTAVTVLILLVIATLFACFRYNGASAIAVIISCLLGTMAYLSIGAILRLSIGLSYFAMLVILNVLIIYFALNIFEQIRLSSWLDDNKYDMAISNAMNKLKFRISLINILIMVFGVLFVLFAPSSIKYIALNIIFIPVVVLAVSLYVVPFVWSALITKAGNRKKSKVAKSTAEKN